MDDREARVHSALIARYGKVIDIEVSPQTIIEIIREFGPELDTVLTPPSPTGVEPSRARRDEPTLRDMMKELLRLSRDVSKIRKHLGA
jgi:hypothetical protein